MSNIKVDNRGGVQTGVAIGDNARALAESVVMSVRQNLPATATSADELKAILDEVRKQLGNEKPPPDDAKEAEDTISKIEREMAKADPNKDRISGWVKVVESVSKTAGYILAGAKVVKDIIG